MKKIQSLLLVLILIISTTSCNKDENEVITTPTTTSGLTGFGSSTTRDFTGQIVDESNLPLAGVTVKIGGISKVTNANGVFSIKNASVNERLAFVTASKTGYLDGSRSIVPTMGNNSIRIMMMLNSPTQMINSGTTSTVTLPNGTKVTFDGAFKTETGTAYTGTVSVALRHLDPNDANIELKMPGNLIAKNTAGTVQVLETFGMMDVVLLGSAGQKLQIANTAQIEVPITATQLATSPATIPLWHFDEVQGIWKEEGTATKMGNSYKGTVSHFSWWNFDGNYDAAFVCIKVVDNNNIPLNNISIVLDVTGYSRPQQSNQYTNTDGMICGNIPANKPFAVKAYDSCGALLATATSAAIPTSNTIVNLPNIVITSLSNSLLSGNLLQCGATPVTNGYVILKYGGKTFVSTVTNGVFDFRTIICGPVNGPYTIEGIDEGNSQTTGIINGLFASPNTFIGDITACSTITEWVKIKVDNNPTKTNIGSINAISTSSNSFLINMVNFGGTTYFGLSGNSITTGVYSTSGTNSFGFESDLLIGTTIISSSYTNNVIFTLSSFGAVGQYIDLTFSGTYTVGGVVHTVSGSCHVKRDS
jgi:hypothetical protein